MLQPLGEFHRRKDLLQWHHVLPFLGKGEFFTNTKLHDILGLYGKPSSENENRVAQAACCRAHQLASCGGFDAEKEDAA